jgi:hypothetical protein
MGLKIFPQENFQAGLDFSGKVKIFGPDWIFLGKVKIF